MAGQQEYSPSFTQGFARSAGESEHPGLWQGLTAAWAPELGRTGSVVFDWAGRRLHGQRVASLWDIDATGVALAFAGTGSFVSLPSRLPFSKNAYTYSLRVYATSNSSDQWLVSDHYSAANNHGRGLSYGGDMAIITIRHGNAITAISTGIVSLRAWHHVVATYDGGSVTIWIDGRRNVTQTAVATDPEAGAMSYLGAMSPGASLFLGKLGSVLSYSRVLSDNEIRQLYLDPTAPFRLRRTTGRSSRLQRPRAAYRRTLASVYGVSP